MSSAIKFYVANYYYSIKVGSNIYSQKKGMIDVEVFDHDLKIAVVAFNENIPKGTLFWQISRLEQQNEKYLPYKDTIIRLAANYLTIKGLNYD